MGAKISLAIGLRTFFTVLGLLMLAIILYTVFTDDLGLRFLNELLTPWMAAALVGFYIDVVALGVWIAYKESNLISSVLWIVLIGLLGRWLAATLVDIYFHVVILAVWVAYKESSWISAIFWIILLICFGRSCKVKRNGCGTCGTTMGT